MTFDRAVNPSTVSASTFRVYGRVSGPVGGSFAFANGGSTASFRPSRAFFAGETVYVNLASTIVRARRERYRTGGYAFSFVTAAQPATRSFTEIDVFSNRTSPLELRRASTARSAPTWTATDGRTSRRSTR